MKTLVKIVAGGVLTLGLATSAVWAETWDDQNRMVTAFDKVSVYGSIDMRVKVGKKRSVTVHAPSDLMTYIETKVDNDTLKVGYERNFKWDRKWNNKDIWIEVTVPTLEGASVKGSGDIRIDGGKGDNFTASVYGSGDLTVSGMAYTTIKTKVKGSGDIVMRGSCNNITVVVVGSGDVSNAGMKCQTANVTIKGSGDVTVHASTSAKARVYGSGDIYVKGSPAKIDTKTAGSGDIHS